jgi:hypothetical protein
LVCAIAVSGIASQYAPGVMERVVLTRQAGITSHDLPPVIVGVSGFIAVEDCNSIGEIWNVRGPKGVERLMVADCSGNETTTDWMSRNNIVMEVDHLTARRWGSIGKGVGVTATSACRATRRYRSE